MAEDSNKRSGNHSELGKLVGLVILGLLIWSWYTKHEEESEREHQLTNTRIEELASGSFSVTPNIRSGGELHKAVSLFSDYTSAQKDAILDRFKGDIVSAESQVMNIEKNDNGTFTLYTVALYGIDYTVNVTPLNPSNYQYILSLRKGNRVRFKGYIYSIFLGNLVLSPGIVLSPGNMEIAIGTIKKDSFRFISCNNETSIPEINFKTIKDGVEFSMTAQGDIYDKLCNNVKSGTILNVEYSLQMIDDIDDEKIEVCVIKKFTKSK